MKPEQQLIPFEPPNKTPELPENTRVELEELLANLLLELVASLERQGVRHERTS